MQRQIQKNLEWVVIDPKLQNETTTQQISSLENKESEATDVDNER